MADVPKIPPVSRRAVLAGGATLAVGAPTLPLSTVGLVSEPDEPLLRACLAYLDAYMETNRLSDDLDAVCAALGVPSESQHPDVVEAWRHVDEACDRASDHINRLTDAKATSVGGAFAKAVAVVRCHLPDDEESSELAHDIVRLMDDLVRVVRPNPNPLVRQILAHPALADVLPEEDARPTHHP